MNHHPRIVTEAELEKALEFLRDSAKALGDAKAETVRASHMVKVTKALCMKLFNDKPVSVQEREALTDERYMAALERDAVAAGEYERLRGLREAASMKIEAWRSEQATWRSMRI